MYLKWTSSELKETILGMLALLWGILLLFPENSLLPYGGLRMYKFYTQDWLWGIYLILSGLFIILTATDGYTRVRKIIHASLWTFWLGISLLVIARTYRGGITETDILIALPFVAIAFLHAAVYTRLAASK